MAHDNAFGTIMDYREGVVAVQDGAFTKLSVVTHIRRILAWRTSYLEGLHPLKPYGPTLRGPSIGPPLVFGTASTCKTHTFVMRHP